MRKFIKVSNKIVDVSMVLGIISIAFMMMFIVVNIIMRKMFSANILGNVEITQQVLVLIIWFGMCVCAKEGEMMTVDILKFPKTYMRVIEVITFVICLFSGIAAIKSGIGTMAVNSGTTQLHIPKCIFQYITGLGFLLTSMAIVANFMKGFLPEEEQKELSGKAAEE